MTNPSFDYEVVMTDDRTRVTSIIAYQERARESLRAVLWSVPRQEWIYAPAVAADIFNDEQDSVPTRSVDRETAERLAEEVLETRLPSEDALVELSLEGERMGWRFGPPAR